MKIHLTLLLTVAAVLGSASASLLPAQVIGAIDNPGNGGSASYSSTVGYAFTLSSNETLDALGVYANGQTETQDISLYSVTLNSSHNPTAETLIATASVDVTAAENGTYQYALTYTPENGFTGTLHSGSDYIIGTEGYSYINENAATTTANGVTLIAAEYDNHPGAGSFPDTADHTGQGYVGPNFEFSPTPEPSTWAMMLIGLGALGFGLRRKITRNS